MSPAEQKEAFQSALCDSLEDCCNVEVVQGVYERLREAIEQHKESKNPEPLALTVGEISSILRDCGVSESKAEAFGEKCGESFGTGAVLNPANLIDSKRFELKTADAAVSIDPERSYLMETQVINGRKYILVPADGGYGGAERISCWHRRRRGCPVIGKMGRSQAENAAAVPFLH